MIPKPAKNWWPLALSGVLYAIDSGMNFFTRRADGSLTPGTFVDRRSTLEHLGMLALAAGVCTIAAGMGSSRKGKSWLLVLNGLASSAIALLIVVMAMSIGIYELAAARALPPSDFLWIGSYFGFSAICMLGLALRNPLRAL